MLYICRSETKINYLYLCCICFKFSSYVWPELLFENLTQYYTNSKRNDTDMFVVNFFWSKGIIFKFSVTELFCFLIRNILQHLKWLLNLALMFWIKMQKISLAHNIFLNKRFQQFSIYRWPA